MNETASLVASLFTIAAGVAGVVTYIIREHPIEININHKKGGVPITIKAKAGFKKFVTIVALIIIVLGFVLRFTFNKSSANAQPSPPGLNTQLQNEYDQIINRPATVTYTLASPDNSWDMGQPIFKIAGSGCSFNDGTYQVTMTYTGAFYPCYLNEHLFTNFLCQVQ